MPVSSRREPKTKVKVKSMRPRAGARRAPRSCSEKNAAPSQWGRRLARLVGEKFNVTMSDNCSKNEGVYNGQTIVIKCAKSTMPPVIVLTSMLERIDQLWAVFLLPCGDAEVWTVDVSEVRQHGYWTHGPNVQARVELYRRKIVRIGTLMAMLDAADVETCSIP